MFSMEFLIYPQERIYTGKEKGKGSVLHGTLLLGPFPECTGIKEGGSVSDAAIINARGPILQKDIHAFLINLIIRENKIL